MDALTESEVPDADTEKSWLARWVLAGYGLALGTAGGIAASENELFAPIRAAGVSALVLGVGCVFLAARGPHRPAAPDVDEPADEVLTAPQAVDLEPAEAETVEADAEISAVDEERVEAPEVEAPEVETPELEVVAEEADDAELRSAIPAQPLREDADSASLTDAVRLERLEAELADERARVDQVSAELAALRRVVGEQRSTTKS